MFVRWMDGYASSGSVFLIRLSAAHGVILVLVHETIAISRAMLRFFAVI